MPIEDVVAEYQSDRVFTDELTANDKSVGQSPRVACVA
jgi:hypothetical protein